MGCGWLGLPLGEALAERNYKIKGTTTREQRLGQLESKGIDPYLIQLDEKEVHGPIDEFLNGLEILVINIPPKLRSDSPENYVAKIKRLKSHLKVSGVHKVIFVSSTSVYGALPGEVRETTSPQPNSESGRQLLESEQLLLADPDLHTTVVRFGGLIGPKRHPANQLSGRKGLKNGDHPVNLIHLDDCLRILISIIEKDWWNTVFNAVYPAYPSKAAYYTSECLKRGLPVPEYFDAVDGKEGKKVKSERLLEKGFVFTTDIVG